MSDRDALKLLEDVFGADGSGLHELVGLVSEAINLGRDKKIMEGVFSEIRTAYESEQGTNPISSVEGIKYLKEQAEIQVVFAETKKIINELNGYLPPLEIIFALIGIREGYERKYGESPHKSVEGKNYIKEELRQLLKQHKSKHQGVA